MEIEVVGRNLRVGNDLSQHVQDRLTAALGQHTANIRTVRVQLEDTNGPKGGVDKRCQVRVHLRPTGDVIVEEVSDDAFAATSQAADRAKVAVTRALERRRE